MHEREHEVDVGEVETDRECTDGERDREQLPDGESSEPPGDRESGERRGSKQVCRDHHSPSVRAGVYPNSCG